MLLKFYIRVVICDKGFKIIRDTDVMVLVIALDAVEQVRQFPLTLDGPVAVKIALIRQDPACV